MFAELFDSVTAFVADPPRLLQLDMLLRIVLQVVLFAASAFFSGSETALFSLSKFDLQRLARSKNPFAETLHRLLEQPRRLIVSILCGNELVNIAAAANMTAILVELLGVEAAAWAATFVMIPLILVFGEVTPKTLAVSNPVWTSTRIVAAPISVWIRLVRPLAFVVRAIADRTTTLIIGPERTEENILHVEEINSLIEQGVEAGEISPIERMLVHSLIRAGTSEVKEIMTPRARIMFLDGALPRSEVLRSFRAMQHARVPVFRDRRDNVIGFLYVEDLLKQDLDRADRDDLSDLLHPAPAVPASRDVDEMLDFFDEQDARAALVVNEFGGVDGMVTLADVTQYLFAGVFTEAPIDTLPITRVEGGWEIDGDAPISEICRATGLDLRDPDMTTIAGLALRRFGRVPAVGETVEADGYLLEVLAVDKFRIARVRVGPVGSQSSGNEVTE